MDATLVRKLPVYPGVYLGIAILLAGTAAPQEGDAFRFASMVDYNDGVSRAMSEQAYLALFGPLREASAEQGEHPLENVTGYGSFRLAALNPHPPNTQGNCAPLRTHVRTYTWGFLPSPPPSSFVEIRPGPIPIVNPLTDRVLSEGKICNSTTSSYSRVTIDAREGLATCSTCAISAAQVWTDGGVSEVKINNFVLATHQGRGWAADGVICYVSFCQRNAVFLGDHALVELTPSVVEAGDRSSEKA